MTCDFNKSKPAIGKMWEVGLIAQDLATQELNIYLENV